MRTVSWSTGPKTRSRVHGLSAFQLKVTNCGKKIGRQGVKYGSANHPTEEEKRYACARCWQ